MFHSCSFVHGTKEKPNKQNMIVINNNNKNVKTDRVSPECRLSVLSFICRITHRCELTNMVGIDKG